MKYLSFLLFFCLLTFTSKAQVVDNHLSHNPNKNGLDSFINNRADSILQKQQLTGLLVAVNDAGQRKFYSFGYANPATKMKYDSTTTVEIGSITKTFTAYVLLKVLQEKSIDDRTSIAKFLPDSVQQNEGIKSITFLNLLNHTSGLPRIPGDIDATVVNLLQPYENYTQQHLYNYLKNFNFRPTEKSNYSNLGAGLAGVLAERISGLTYEQLLNKYIHKPFGIKLCGVLTVKETPNKAIGFKDKMPSEYWNMAILSPAGGIKYNAASMLTYLQHIVQPSDGNKIILDSLTAATVALNANINIGRAWHTYERKNKPTIYWHNGGTYGFSTFCGFVKGTNKMVFIAINEFNRNSICDGVGIAILNKLLQ